VFLYLGPAAGACRQRLGVSEDFREEKGRLYRLRSSRPLVRARVPGVSLRVAGLLHQPPPVGGRDRDARAGLGGVAAGELRVLDDGQLLDQRT